MSRWMWFWLCAILGLALVAAGWLVPAHLRAVDASVLEAAGQSTASLVEKGLALAHAQNAGAAQLCFVAAQQENLPAVAFFATALTNLAHTKQASPASPISGSALEPAAARKPFTEFIILQENRQNLLEVLQGSRSPAVQELLRCRSLTNTAIFSPSGSASGQAFDGAVGICGLLIEDGHLTSSLSNSVYELAFAANRGGRPQDLEQVLFDFLSLGRRLDWGQLAVLVQPVQEVRTLDSLAYLVQRHETNLPVLFSVIVLSGQPAGVAQYLADFSRTGMRDLVSSLHYGAGGLHELLRRHQPLYHSTAAPRLIESPGRMLVELTWRQPAIALGLKWVLYLAGGFFLAMSLHYARPTVSALERPLQVRGFHLAREILFALGFLLVVLLLSEPFLAQESQKVDLPSFRLQLPTVGGAVSAGIAGAKASFMNQLSLLTLLLFFVLQALIYVACLVKLAEIRRQKTPPRIKLKLLENEDHLFDAGLYLGFVGTIISLILVSLGVIKPSLMAAYSSTSFGIIFVSIFKIFHLRPVRRKLLLEAEAFSPPAMGPAVEPSLVVPS